jgi:hypothetical protein
VIEYVNRSRRERKNFTACHILDLALTLDDIVGFNVMLIPEDLFRARDNRGFGQGITNTILGQQKAAAGPDLAAHIARGINNLI